MMNEYPQLTEKLRDYNIIEGMVVQHENVKYNMLSKVYLLLNAYMNGDTDDSVRNLNEWNEEYFTQTITNENILTAILKYWKFYKEADKAINSLYEEVERFINAA